LGQTFEQEFAQASGGIPVGTVAGQIAGCAAEDEMPGSGVVGCDPLMHGLDPFTGKPVPGAHDWQKQLTALQAAQPQTQTPQGFSVWLQNNIGTVAVLGGFALLFIFMGPMRR